MRYADSDEPCMTRLTTMAAMPASTALACGTPARLGLMWNTLLPEHLNRVGYGGEMREQMTQTKV